MTCKCVSYLGPEGPPYYVTGTSRAVTRCDEHHVNDVLVVDGLCPIGRIEKAVEDGLAEIADAIRSGKLKS